MLRSIMQMFVLVIFILTSALFAGQDNDPRVVEHLGEKIPIDLKFKDENGNTVQLKDLLKKSNVIDFVYYHCPGICTPLMSEVANVVGKVDLIPGKDYKIISISMDENETPKMAAKKKNDIMTLIDKNVPSNGWNFLTGDSASIAKISDAAGFYFKRHKKDFVHTGVIIFVSEDGKICRYLYPSYSRNKEFGILPFDFKMANMETAEGKEVPVVGKILQFCFSYDPQSKTYVFNLLKIFGAGILLLTAAFVIFFIVRPKKSNLESR